MKYLNMLILALLLTNNVEARQKDHKKVSHNITNKHNVKIIEHIRHLTVISTTTATNNKFKHEEDENTSTFFNQRQRAILKVAYSTAKQEGLKNPVILPGIILHESGAGTAAKFRTSKHKAAHDQTVGLGQIKTGTAKAILSRHPEIKQHMRSKDIQHELAYNDEFNIYIAALYLKDLQDDAHSDNQLIAAYNLGHIIKRPEKMGYVKLVNRSIGKIKREQIL